MTTTPNPPKRARVYCDGLNMFGGVLKRSSNSKWLDVKKLVEILLAKEGYTAIIEKVLYFSAHMPSLPTHPDRAINQTAYIEALQQYYSNTEFEFIPGRFASRKKTGALIYTTPASPTIPTTPPDVPLARVKVFEEKGTDVNIGVHIVNDSWSDGFDIVVLVSNDSDLSEALKIARAKGKKIVLIVPLKPIAEGRGKGVGSSADLKVYAHTHIGEISSTDLQAAQLPDPITNQETGEVIINPNTGNPITKPSTW